MTYLSDFEYLQLFRRYSLSKFEVIQNCTKFSKFLVPKVFFGEGSPKILDLIFKIQPSTHHDAKFHDDRLTELGDTMANK